MVSCTDESHMPIQSNTSKWLPPVTLATFFRSPWHRHGFHSYQWLLYNFSSRISCTISPNRRSLGTASIRKWLQLLANGMCGGLFDLWFGLVPLPPFSTSLLFWLDGINLPENQLIEIGIFMASKQPKIRLPFRPFKRNGLLRGMFYSRKKNC